MSGNAGRIEELPPMSEPQRVLTKVVYLEMRAPSERQVTPPATDIRIQRACGLSVEQYRELYRGVGAAYHWTDRIRMPDALLRGIIEDDRVEIYVLYVADRPAGYAELDRRVGGEVELSYFGLFPAFVGRGLGAYFLSWALAQAWSYGPRRVWVHTCDLDHPAALPLYLRAGFVAYDQRTVEQPADEG
jgi:GNAT superfamily N-acetyltransferase